MALVEDLPSIPGPQTVGAENYSRIVDAFEERGWSGFEEEFDNIVPRERPNYEEVKRRFAAGPMFNIKSPSADGGVPDPRRAFRRDLGRGTARRRASETTIRSGRDLGCVRKRHAILASGAARPG
jgi:hypothetical protein